MMAELEYTISELLGILSNDLTEIDYEYENDPAFDLDTALADIELQIEVIRQAQERPGK